MVASGLLVTAIVNAESFVLTSGVSGVGALVMLDVAAADESVLQAAEARVAVDAERLSGAASVGHCGGSDTAESVGEGLEVGVG